MERSSGRHLPAVYAAVLLALAFSGVLGGRALAGSHCEVALNGTSLRTATGVGSAIALPRDANVLVRWTSDRALTSAKIGVAVGGLTLFERPLESAGGTQGSGTIDLAEQAPSIAGLYEVVVTLNDCEVRGLVRLEGPSVLETPAGWVAVGGMALGGLGLLSRLLKALRGRGSVRGSFLAGALTGGSVLLFSQQSGMAAITPMSLTTWMLGPGLASGAAQVVLSVAARAVRGGSRRPAATASRPTASRPTASRKPTARPTAARPSALPAAERMMDLDVRLPGTAPSTTGAARRDELSAGATAPSATETAPPRTTYARVECPDAVVVRTEFELIVGLMARPDPRVAGFAMTIPDWISGAYTMTVQVVADGFSLRPGESWRVELPVTGRDPYPARVLHLTAEAGSSPVRAAYVRAMYSVAGQPIGLAVRSIAVVSDASLLTDAPRPPAAPAIDLTLPEGPSAPDLTVRIERADSQASGRLLVQLLTADPTIATPDAPIPVDIGGEPAADLRAVITRMNGVEGTATQYVTLRGIGLTIADQLPHEFWGVLREVASRTAGRAPTILFLSAEPYVPWELAVVEPPLDPDAPPFLSAQANVGRWVLGQRRPKLPPPARHSVTSIAVVSGKYELPGWVPLAEAEAEAADIARTFGAASIDATTPLVLDLLRGEPSSDLIHFAVHGNVNADGIEDGLILVDGTALGPLAVRGTALRGTPFVFLNACQVGQGQQILGDHAGLAEAFLFAGACGVIAPLWSVDDDVARRIALRFYEGALAGDTAAEILRRERAAFRDSPETSSTTYLAYQYFGHPGLRLERSPTGTATRTTTTTTKARDADVSRAAAESVVH